MQELVLGLINPGMSLIFALGAFVLWSRDRRNRYLLGFMVAPLALGTSLTISHFNPVPDAMLPRLAAYFFSVLGCASIAWAACVRLGRPVPVKTWIAVGGIGFAVTVAAIVAGSFDAHLFAVNAACGVVFVMAAQLMAQAGSRALVDRAMLWVFVLIAAQFFIRPMGVIIVEGAMTATEYRQSVGFAVLTASSAIMTLMLAATVLAAVLSDQIHDLQIRSESDPLTGLPLRRGFEKQVEQVLTECEQSGTPISLILADIDHFKQVNDLWGHQAGDRAIANFGQLIASTIRSTDFAGRIGGEEFCVLVWDCSLEQAHGLAERLRVGLAQTVHDGINDDVRLTASFGVTTVQRGEGYARAFSRADAALYAAKQAGRNAVRHEGELANVRPADRTAPAPEPLAKAS